MKTIIKFIMVTLLCLVMFVAANENENETNEEEEFVWDGTTILDLEAG